MEPEEMKAIERLKLFIDMVDKKWKLEITNSNKLKTILNIIEKQQKEIEELKEITKTYNSYIGEKIPLNSKIIIADREYFMNGTFVNNYVNKNKIRKEIEETEKELYNGDILQRFAYIKIETLKDLLEE